MVSLIFYLFHRFKAKVLKVEKVEKRLVLSKKRLLNLDLLKLDFK